MDKWLSQRDQNFIKWSQQERCLVCDYPVDLGVNWHHIIARDDGGPDHYLNIVALCPNHHRLVEKLKRLVIPIEKRSSPQWLRGANAAKRMYDKLDIDVRALFDILSKPHPLTDPIHTEIPHRFVGAFATEVIEADKVLLKNVNQKRPRIFLPFDCVGAQDDGLDQYALLIAQKIGPDFYSAVVNAHMLNLELSKGLKGWNGHIV